MLEIAGGVCVGLVGSITIIALAVTALSKIVARRTIERQAQAWLDAVQCDYAGGDEQD